MRSTSGLPSPVGVFHSHVTHDAAGAERDGQPFFDVNPLDERAPAADGQLWEILFADGHWMLARTPDLTFLERGSE